MNKTLFKNEKQADLFKIGLTIFLYLIVFSIFKAGLDFQKLVPIKLLEKPEKNITYTYNLNVNGKLRYPSSQQKSTWPLSLSEFSCVRIFRTKSLFHIFNPPFP